MSNVLKYGGNWVKKWITAGIIFDIYCISIAPFYSKICGLTNLTIDEKTIL
jgi:hypothetical protein